MKQSQIRYILWKKNTYALMVLNLISRWLQKCAKAYPEHLFFMWIELRIVIWYMFWEIWAKVKKLSEIKPPLTDCLTNSFFSFYLDEPLTICTHTVVEAGKTSSLIHKESNFCPVTLRHSLIVISVFSSLDKMTKSDEVTGREKAIWNWLFLCRAKKVFQNFFLSKGFWITWLWFSTFVWRFEPKWK